MSEILPRFYVHVDNEKWIIVRMGDSHIVFGSATSSTPVWQPWHGWQDKNVEDGAWVEITYANMRPPTRELDDLRAELKEKTREIERLRAELDSENQTVNTLTRKLKATLDRQDRLEEDRRQGNPVALRELIIDVMNSWADERQITQRLADLEVQGNKTVAKLSNDNASSHDRYRRLDDRISKVVDNTSAQFHAHRQVIEKLEKSVEKAHRIESSWDNCLVNIADLAKKVDNSRDIALTNLKALQNQFEVLDKSTREAQRIEASRHEALRQRVEKIERVVPQGSGNLQTIVENLADRMAADPQNAFQTYVDTRIQRISSWFDTKLSALGDQERRLATTQSGLHDRLVVVERKIAALEESENALIDELEGKTDRNTQDINARISRLDQKVSAISSDEASLTKDLANATSRLNDLQAKTYHNTVDLQSLSVRITNLEAKQ